MHVINPAKITRKLSSCQSNPTFLETMILEIDNTSTTVSTTSDASSTTITTTTAKKQSFFSHGIYIHPKSPLPSSTSLNKRRLPIFDKNSRSSSSSSSCCCSGRFAELAGGTTAECAAICCCCPCGLVNLLYLTIYKVPAGLYRRALRRKRRKQLMKKGLLPPRIKRCRCGCDETEIHIHPASSSEILETEILKFDEEEEVESDEEEDDDIEEEENDAMVKLEKEMWETFYSTGFWRSPSQREPAQPNIVIKDSSTKVKPL